MSSPKHRQKHLTFIEVARTIGQLGTCDRAHVGAVIVLNGRCISWGYNGAPPGAPHCDENGHGWQDVNREGFSVREALEMNGCRNSTHAEANAIAFAARQGISTDGATLYVERTPCLNCAHLIVAAGIHVVVCSRAYRDTSGEELLRRCSIPVWHLHGDEADDEDA